MSKSRVEVDDSEGEQRRILVGALVAGGDVHEGWFSLQAADALCRSEPGIGGYTWQASPPISSSSSTVSGSEEEEVYVYFKPPGHEFNEDPGWRYVLRPTAPQAAASQGGDVLSQRDAPQPSAACAPVHMECLPGAISAGGDIWEGWHTFDEACAVCRGDPAIGGFTWQSGGGGSESHESSLIYVYFKTPGHPHNDDPDWCRMVKTADG
mmetsp:Transcript_11497/g.32610  ORF Transcript_11497/g.32610 Transcript_11497/m.32610 type:complete len:209 (+) Transcript_11497:165-791(+)